MRMQSRVPQHPQQRSRAMHTWDARFCWTVVDLPRRGRRGGGVHCMHRSDPLRWIQSDCQGVWSLCQYLLKMFLSMSRIVISNFVFCFFLRPVSERSSVRILAGLVVTFSAQEFLTPLFLSKKKLRFVIWGLNKCEFNTAGPPRFCQNWLFSCKSLLFTGTAKRIKMAGDEVWVLCQFIGTISFFFQLRFFLSA